MSEDVNRNINETLQYNIGTIIHEFNHDERQTIRSIENLSKKQTNARYAVIFTETCIRENLLPKFTNIRLYDQAVQQSEQTLGFRRNLLKEEARKKKRILDDITNKLSDASKSYQELNVSVDLKQRTDDALQDLIQVHERVVKTRIVRKLSSLYGGQVNIPEKNDSYVNLSSHVLTEDQK